MKVVTLDKVSFLRHCEMLAEKICAEEKHFDAMVCILNGGGYVAEKLGCMNISALFQVSLQRDSTKKKKRFLSSFLRFLPYGITDRLRIFEAKSLQKKKSEPKKVTLPDSLTAFLQKNSGSRVLVVDDAVDSGESMLAVVKAIRHTDPKAVVKTAAITVTTPHPAIMPDYFIYNDGTLIRFPWSIDYHEKDSRSNRP